MALDNNVKSIRTYAKDINPAITVTMQGCIDKATEFGLDANQKLSTKDRKALAQALCESAGSQLATVTNTHTLTTQEETAMHTTNTSQGSQLTTQGPTSLDIKGAALEIRKLGNADQIAASERLLVDYALGMANDMETLKQLLSIIAETKSAMYNGLVTTINALDDAYNTQLKDFADALEERNKRNKASMERSIQVMRDNLKKFEF